MKFLKSHTAKPVYSGQFQVTSLANVNKLSISKTTSITYHNKLAHYNIATLPLESVSIKI